MKRLTQLFLLLPLIWAAGCQKETVQQGNEVTVDKGEATVHIHTSLADPFATSKAPYQEETFSNGFNYGIYVCDNETTASKHKSNSWNLMASFTKGNDEQEGAWSYYYIDNLNTGSLISNGYDNITITDKVVASHHVTADLYAYAPYIAEAYESNPTSIPFVIADNIRDQADLMYAVENDADNPTNKGLDPLSEGEEPLEAHFTFRHAMALLAFEFEIKNYLSTTNTSTYKLSSITVKRTAAANETKLIKKGTFNAITGGLSGNNVSDIKVINDVSIIHKEGADGIAYLLLAPTEVEDDALEFTFTMLGANVSLPPFVLKKEFLKHGDSNDYGFQPGYKYTFKFTLDNYLYLDGITINETWSDINDLDVIEI